MSDRATQQADAAAKRAASLATLKASKKRGGQRGNRNARRHEAVPPPRPHLLDRVQVCALTGFSYPTLLQWMKEQRFPSARLLGNRNVWLSSEIEQWLVNLPLSPLTNLVEKETA
jgi:predicted DNA-binding transcriptional regulator AlpA